MSKKPNRLINEKSPYLLAHAYNPVDWFPWCSQAFDKAKEENKPIFLSIGYSSCHWCHVMEEESFEDPEIADILNRYFVPIKVDREERPDIDSVYMEVCLLFNGNGGWPLTVIMTPDKEPFFAGTYFPKDSRPGRIGLKDLLLSVAHHWKENKEDLLKRGRSVIEYIRNGDPSESEFIDRSVIERCYRELESRFDEKYGGFSKSPKFPSPHNLMFLLRYYWLKEDPRALEMVCKTMKSMRYGGIFDHIGFGFHRYSTDRQWLLPHFEKMLYDQGMLLMAYSEAYQITLDEFYKGVVEEIVEYLKRDMMDKDGGFYSSEDADSEGEEGKFYTFEYQELRELFGEDFKLFSEVFYLSPEGNYTEESTGKPNGRNIIYLPSDFENISEKLEIDTKLLKEKIKIWREKLFQMRANKPRPFKDTKILTDWNSIILISLSKAGKSTKNREYLNLALNLYNFLRNKLFKDGKLYHMYKDGEVSVEGMLDDYAFLIWGCIELYEATSDVDILNFALRLQGIADSLFYDKHRGGYFLSNQEEDLIVKPKPIYDGAYPCGNSIMINNLIKLYHITSNNNLYDRAIKTIGFFSGEIDRHPSYHSMSVIGSMMYFYPVCEVLLSGDCIEILTEINARFLPQKVVISKNSENLERLASISPFTGSIPIEDGCRIYICKDFGCNLPTTDLNYTLRILEEKSWI